MKSAWLAAVPLLILSLCPMSGAPGKTAGPEELFPNLAITALEYVERVGSVLESGDRKVLIGVYDKTSGSRYMRQFVKRCDEEPDRYELVDLEEGDFEGRDFDLVYIAGRKVKPPLDILSSFANKPVLIVGEHDKLLDVGGIIRFQVSSEKSAEYGINLKQAKLSGLRIQSRLSRNAAELIR